MSTVLLLLDAFRSDYLSKEITPFLWKCAHEGEYYENVEQSYGYCERSEMLTGINGKESGFFTAIGYDPVNSPFKNMRFLFLLDKIESLLVFFLNKLPNKFSSRVQKKIRNWVSHFFKRKGINMPSFLIPYTWLPFFSLTEDRIDHRNSLAFKKKSILELLSDSNKRYYYDSFSSLSTAFSFLSDEERLSAVLADGKKDIKDLYLIYIASPDAFGHIFGPESEKFKEILFKMDQQLERFVDQFEKQSPDTNFLFLGDHGMASVKNHVDIEKEICSLLSIKGLRKGKDFIYFLDSTIVRVWSLNEKTKSIMCNELKESIIFKNHGTWIDCKAADKLGIHWPDSRYGDELWLANNGIIVFPDFFHSYKPCKGMHGYNPKLQESKGTCIIWSKKIKKERHSIMPLTNVFCILRKLLNI